MKAKSNKITFSTFNAGKFTVIKHSAIAQSNKRIKSEMKQIRFENNKKQIESRKHASKFLLNT